MAGIESCDDKEDAHVTLHGGVDVVVRPCGAVQRVILLCLCVRGGGSVTPEIVCPYTLAIGGLSLQNDHRW